jgi:hypothetical protein
MYSLNQEDISKLVALKKPITGRAQAFRVMRKVLPKIRMVFIQKIKWLTEYGEVYKIKPYIIKQQTNKYSKYVKAIDILMDLEEKDVRY